MRFARSRWALSLVCFVCLVTLRGQAPTAPATPEGYEAISFESTGAGGATVRAYLKRPQRSAPIPLVVLLHGCGGLFTRSGKMQTRDIDWADRLVAAGYAVLHVDSFNPRGFREICTKTARERSIVPRERAKDAAAAIEWALKQSPIDPARIALVGWSNGGSTVLWTVQDGEPAAGKLKTAIAFYPGCRVPSERGWKMGAPLTILIGADDDWTPPETCRLLASRFPAIRYVEYPGAVHGFDSPNSPLRTRTDVGQSPRGDGTARVGTDPKARAAAIDVVMATLAAAFK
jgi:dienelactone hydrolase